MTADPNVLIRVHGRWNGWSSAEVPLADLEQVHWFQPASAPHPLLHAYISCNRIPIGSLDHDCDRRSAPHRERVCILKRHAVPTLYTRLAQQADDERAAAVSAVRASRPSRLWVRLRQFHLRA